MFVFNFKPYFYEYTDVFNFVQKATQIYKPQIQFILFLTTTLTQQWATSLT